VGGFFLEKYMMSLLPILMALMMFTMGLTLEKKDFQRVVLMPRAMITGSICQLIFLPILGFIISRMLSLSNELTIGFLVLCACPGGILSNYVSFTANGDKALSISLTLVSSIVCVFSIPLVINGLQSVLDVDKTVINLPLFDTMKTIALLTLVPIILGMIFKEWLPNSVGKLSERLNKVCSLMLIVYVLYLWYIQKEAIVSAFSSIGIPVLFLIALSSVMAWISGRLVKLPKSQKITLVIETSIQNAALAFTVTVVIMQNPLYSIPTVFYTVAMFIPALILIILGRKTKIRDELTSSLE
jgi:bile acid:Na+ symporter, BASS family